MDDFLVDGGAQGGGKTPIALERRDGFQLPRPPLGEGVQVGRGDAGFDEADELAEDVGDDPIAFPHRPDLGFGLVDDHVLASAPLAPFTTASRTARTDPKVVSMSMEPSTRRSVFFPP